MGQTTAIEWLFKQLWEEPKDKMVWYAILDKAKEMEKEQIMDAHEQAYIKMNMSFSAADRAEQYYEETYKK
jgi:hypothetical protein